MRAASGAREPSARLNSPPVEAFLLIACPYTPGTHSRKSALFHIGRGAGTLPVPAAGVIVLACSSEYSAHTADGSVTMYWVPAHWERNRIVSERCVSRPRRSLAPHPCRSPAVTPESPAGAVRLKTMRTRNTRLVPAHLLYVRPAMRAIVPQVEIGLHFA